MKRFYHVLWSLCSCLVMVSTCPLAHACPRTPYFCLVVACVSFYHEKLANVFFAFFKTDCDGEIDFDKIRVRVLIGNFVHVAFWYLFLSCSMKI